MKIPQKELEYNPLQITEIKMVPQTFIRVRYDGLGVISYSDIFLKNDCFYIW